MNQSKTKNALKRVYLINRDFQLRYANAAVIVGFISTVFTMGLILYPLYQFEILRIPRFLPTPVLVFMSVAALINMAIIGLLGVFMTHKIAGPMYSLVRQFRSVEEGGSWSSQMKLRDDDELRYVVRNFNSMMSIIQKAVLQDLAAIEDIKEKITSGSFTSPDEKQDLLEVVSKFEERIKPRFSISDNP